MRLPANHLVSNFDRPSGNGEILVQVRGDNTGPHTMENSIQSPPSKSENELRGPKRRCERHTGFTVIVLILAAASACLWASVSRAAPIETEDVHVIDGDTIRV